MKENQVLRELSQLILGCRIKVTQENSPTETMRFERKVERVEISDQEGFIELRLDKDVPSEYGLLKQRIIHFCPVTKTYRGILKTRESKHHLFKVEIVGLRYVGYIEELEKFGIAIAGHDIRVIMFEKLFEKFGAPVTYPKHEKRVMETFGEELKKRAAEFLQDNRFSLTDNEQYVMKKYLL